MGIQKEFFGIMPDGREVSRYWLANSGKMKVSVIDYGGIITEIHAPDRLGNTADVTLGFDSFEPYLKNPHCFGAVVGRHANRIENAEFELNGRVYKLLKNNGNNHLHGGAEGFQKKLWGSRAVTEGGMEKLELTYRSADMEEGYPGALDVKVLYWLDDEGSLAIEYRAVSDKDTVVNLTNHAYFNLAGHGSGDMLGHVLTIHADQFTAINGECIPTGEIRGVAGTPLDFRTPKAIGEGLMHERECEQMAFGHGYDHNYVLNGFGRGLAPAAEAYEPQSGRRMSVLTDKPGVQFYSGNYINVQGKGGAAYRNRAGFCLETQFFPNSMRHRHFPSPVLRAGEPYRFTTVYRFTAD